MMQPEWATPQAIFSIFSLRGLVFCLLLMFIYLNSAVVYKSSSPNAHPSPNPQDNILFLLVNTIVWSEPQAICVTTSSDDNRIWLVASIYGFDPLARNFSFINIIYSMILSIDDDRSFNGD
jgi:hypothetical protein